MPRRLHVPTLTPGDIELDPVQAHHARDVLRLRDGQTVEAFDDQGATATAALVWRGAQGAAIRVNDVRPPAKPTRRLTVTAAVPKGERADWMVEKLSELGVDAFIPLATERSVVLPAGRGKHDRWVRIATESAKQSRRAGVMRIEPLTSIKDLIERKLPHAWVLSTGPGAVPIREAFNELPTYGDLTLLIGAEGGWTEQELELFRTRGIRAVRLTRTVLRIETAAIAAAAIIAGYAYG